MHVVNCPAPTHQHLCSCTVHLKYTKGQRQHDTQRVTTGTMVFIRPDIACGGGGSSMSARVTSRANRQSGPPRVAHTGLAVNRASAANRSTAYATAGYSSVDNQSQWDTVGLDDAQAFIASLAPLPVITHPAGSHAAAAQHLSPRSAGASTATSKQPVAATAGANSSCCSHALPEELLKLADASAPVLLPRPGSVPAGSLDNRELDKLVGTLGRNKATWRRALVLSQWLQESGHILDDRLCTTLIRVCSEHGQAVTALSVYEWMKAPAAVGGAGLAPTVYTYTAAMRAALSAGLLDRALQIWADAQAAECPLDCRLCITYIEVCSRKGLTDRALAMYGTMRSAPKGSKLAPTVHAYTAAMRAATEGGCWQTALEMWTDMKAAGVPPTGHAFAAAMSACAAGSNWQQAVALFEDMCQAGIKPDVVSCTALISALAAAGQWQRSEAVVQWMLSTGVRPNVRTYTALLTALGNAQQWDRALEMLQLMQQSSWGGVVPNSYTYSALLKCLGECGEWRRAESLFSMLEQQAIAAAAGSSSRSAAGTSAELASASRSGPSWQATAAAAAGVGGVGPGLLGSGPGSGSADYSVEVGRARGLDAEVAPGVWGWQAAYGRQGLIQKPNDDPNSSISASSSRGDLAADGDSSGQAICWNSASELHGLDLQLQHEAAAGQSSTTSSSGNGSVRSESPNPAQGAGGGSTAASSSSHSPAGISSNMLAQQLAQLALQQQLAANVDLQLLMLQQQQYHQSHALAQYALKQQQQQQQSVVLQHQQQSRRHSTAADSNNSSSKSPCMHSGAAAGVVINDVVVGSLMLAYERAGKWQEAVGVLARAAAMGVPPNAVMYNTAISAAGKAGQLAVADALFTQARAAAAADSVTYETMIGVLGMAGDAARAEVMFRAMQAAGMKPGDYTYCALIAAHSLAGDAASALRVRARMLRDGCSVGVHVYNSLIAAADRSGMFDKALDLIRTMRREGVEPNALTQQLATEIGRKGAATVEGQQITAAALSAAMAAAGTLLIRSGVF